MIDFMIHSFDLTIFHFFTTAACSKDDIKKGLPGKHSDPMLIKTPEFSLKITCFLVCLILCLSDKEQQNSIFTKNFKKKIKRCNMMFFAQSMFVSSKLCSFFVDALKKFAEATLRKHACACAMPMNWVGKRNCSFKALTFNLVCNDKFSGANLSTTLTESISTV